MSEKITLRQWLNKFHNTQYFINGYGDVMTKKEVMQIAKKISKTGLSGIGLGRDLDKKGKVWGNGKGFKVLKRISTIGEIQTIESHNQHILENHPNEILFNLIVNPKKQKNVGLILKHPNYLGEKLINELSPEEQIEYLKKLYC